MTLYAFKNGVTPFEESRMNPLLALQPFFIAYEGAQRAAKTGSGVLENSIASYSYCTRFTLTGATEIGRVELEIDKDGNGADLIVQIRSGMTPASGADGTLLKETIIPKEWIALSPEYISVPIGLTGLTSGGQYWLVVVRNGDSTNKLDWVGETTQDASYPAYQRAADAGAWSVRNALHFKVFSGVSGLPVHIVEGGTVITTVKYTSGLPSALYTYIPPEDGPDGGVRDILTISYSGGLPVKGV
jgi:hypothetical protein